MHCDSHYMSKENGSLTKPVILFNHSTSWHHLYFACIFVCIYICICGSSIQYNRKTKVIELLTDCLFAKARQCHLAFSIIQCTIINCIQPVFVFESVSVSLFFVFVSVFATPLYNTIEQQKWPDYWPIVFLRQCHSAFSIIHCTVIMINAIIAACLYRDLHTFRV